MEPLSVTASIIAVIQLLTKVTAYLLDTKNASKDCTQCAKEASNLNILLFKLKSRLGEKNLGQPWHTAVRDFAAENGPLDQFKQALETLQMKMTDGRLKQALTWKFRKEEIASILARIERLKTLVDIALQMDHFELSKAIRDDTSFIRTHVPAIRSEVDTIRQHQDWARHRELLEWISPTDYPTQQSDIIKRRHEGTGQWFFHAPEVAQWLGEPKATLFCPGIPGAGKTMIAAIAIDHLLKLAENNSDGIAYVYCNYKAREQQDASSMLAAILKQLIQGQPSTVELAEGLHERHANRGTKPSLDEICSALQNVVARYPTIYIVVDALDECRDSDGTHYRILSELRDLQVRGDVRLMATSRFIPEITGEFRGALELEVRASDEDVKRFVDGQKDRFPKCIQSDPVLRSLIREKIVEAVDGMFLLARLHTDSLSDKRTPKKVKSALAQLPKGSAALDIAYGHALQRIKDQSNDDCKLAKDVLSWITFARRPLTTTELCCALAIESGDVELDPENVPDIEELVSRCAGLVVVDPESAVVRLVHYTTQEYFERTIDAWNPDAQLEIATICLTYLSFNVFSSGHCHTDEEFKDRLRENHFLDYAAQHWGNHVSMVEAEVSDLAITFLLNQGCVICAEQVLFGKCGFQYHFYYRDFVVGTNLHLVARFGLSRITQILLDSLQDDAAVIINREDCLYRTALSIAAEHGHHELAQVLLDRGTDINNAALFLASLEGHEQVVKLLLDEGAEINCIALEVASSQGHEQIVKLLLDRGAKVNCGALKSASWKGYEQIVKLLLDHGAETNCEALEGASVQGHEQIVKLLLDQGTDINCRALMKASLRGHEQIVKLLLDQGAEINCEALEAASSEGHEQIVKLLLDQGADTNCGALYTASKKGYKQIVKLLLDQGTDINARGERGSALYTASINGYEQIVKLLLDQGANIDTQGEYGSALYAASMNGHEQVVKLLLDQGAEINCGALYTASGRGHEQIVKLLLDQGADVNARGKHGSALYVASMEGYKQIVKLLLDRGADVNAQSGHFANALNVASVKGYEQIVKLLLDQGADVNAQGRYGNAPCSAAYGGHEKVLQLLISCENPSQLYDPYGRTLLWWAAAGGHTAIVEALINQYGFKPQVGDSFGRTPLWIATQKGHDAVSCFLVEKCEEMEVERRTPAEDDIRWPYVDCDVCTLKIKSAAFHYHCRNCANGDWDMCEDCRKIGASCADATHILVKRTWRDDDWAEEVD